MTFNLLLVLIISCHSYSDNKNHNVKTSIYPGISDSNISHLNHIISISKSVSIWFYVKDSYLICPDSLFKEFIIKNKDFISPIKNLKGCASDQIDGKLIFNGNDNRAIYSLSFSLECPNFYFNGNDSEAYAMSDACLIYFKEKEIIAKKLERFIY